MASSARPNDRVAPTAADEQTFQFPDWAPRELCVVYEREAVPCELTAEERNTLGDLLNRPVMEGVWNDLKKAAQHEKVIAFHGVPLANVEYNFGITIIHAYRGKQGEECWTPRQQKARLKAVKKHATALADLVRGTTWDDWINALWRRAGWQVPKQGIIRSLSLPYALSEFLVEFAEFAESQMRPSVLQRPNAEHADELYFKRYLSAYCNTWLRDPCFSIVTRVAQLSYGGSDRLEEAVKRTKEQVCATPPGPLDEAIKDAVAYARKEAEQLNGLDEAIKYAIAREEAEQLNDLLSKKTKN